MWARMSVHLIFCLDLELVCEVSSLQGTDGGTFFKVFSYFLFGLLVLV
jgi:hypothetical protein